MLQLIVMWLLGLWLGNHFFPAIDGLAFGGLALGYTISTFLELILLLWLLRRKMGGVGGRRVLSGVWRMVLASLFMAAITWSALQQFDSISALWQLLVAGFAGTLAYLLASLLLGVTELRQLWSNVQRRL
jgi:putative peptidoglycan lipid II flippase